MKGSTMTMTRRWRSRLAALVATSAALAVTAGGAVAADGSRWVPRSHHDDAPVVRTADGTVRGVAVPGGFALPGAAHAAPPPGPPRRRAPPPPPPRRGGRAAPPHAPPR